LRALTTIRIPGVEITKAVGNAIPLPGMPAYFGPVPAHCPVDGVINRRTGVGGQEFGIGFAVTLPEHWNNDFLMQGCGGANGFIAQPLGALAAGKVAGLARGFAVSGSDTPTQIR
jgi:Tannase and feruloyl esterase